MNGRLREVGGDDLAMRSVGMLAYIEAELDAMEDMLALVPTWRPAQALRAQAAWVRQKVQGLGASWSEKLVVAIVGPSGAGKSTLLNALAGRMLSPVGLTRPTTRGVVVYAESVADGEGLATALGRAHVRIETAPESDTLRHLILIDTPDTNTTPENRELLARVLEHVDLMLAVFPAQNPHMADNVDFLRPFVQQLPPVAVVPILNMVDRVPRAELADEIVPRFRAAVADEWGVDGRPYLISAGSVAPGAWPAVDDEQPLHDLNEFDALRAFIYDSLDRANQVVDTRVARAEHLLSLLRAHVCRALRDTGEWRRRATEGLVTLDDRARESLIDASGVGAGAVGLDAHAAFYGRVGPRWWGPVGWLIAAWGLLLRVLAYLAHLGRPSGSLYGGDRAVSPAPRRLRDSWADAVAQLRAEAWPPIADALMQAGFSRAAQGGVSWRDEAETSLDALDLARARAYDAQLDRLATRLSAWPLQAMLNAPVVGMVGWVAFETLGSLFRQQYLSGDYFRHAAIATAMVWLVSFVFWQVLAAMALGRSLHRAVARSVAGPAAETLTAALRGELDVLRSLEQSYCLEGDRDV